MARQELLPVAGPCGQMYGQRDPGDDDGGEVVMMTAVRWCHQRPLTTGSGAAGKKRLSTLTTQGGRLLPLAALERLVGNRLLTETEGLGRSKVATLIAKAKGPTYLIEKILFQSDDNSCGVFDLQYYKNNAVNGPSGIPFWGKNETYYML
ncbi:hypothetical protein MRX96_043459 [Rhipicephalus microplus]